MNNMNNQNKQNKPSWWSNANTWVKKQYFNGTHMLDIAWNNNTSNLIWIFGCKYNSNQEGKLKYSTVLWFTYRQNLSFKSNPDVKSDVGWGCMLRVGQMMLAQVLRLSAGFEMYYDKKYIKKIVNEFMLSEGKYSIEKIVQIGNRIYEKKAGQWYSPSHISYTLRQLQQKNNMNQVRPIVFDNEFQFNSALKMIEKPSNSSHSPSLLVIILIRIGFTTPQQNLLEQTVNILKNEPNCVGILGGRPGRAHYIIGTTQKHFLYLDPHCVKQQLNEQSFFSDKLFSIQHEQIDPSMGLCFYIKNVDQLVLLHEKFALKKSEIPFYSYNNGEKPKIIQIGELTQQFQILDQI